MVQSKNRGLRLAAVGDILLSSTRNGAGCYQRHHGLVSDRVRAVFDECDLVFGNLECTLASGADLVPTEPRVIANESLVRAVPAAGFSLVTLANNHMFDGLGSGFQKLTDVLDEVGLQNFGAGLNLSEAVAPALLEVNGIQLAFIGAVDHRSGPFQFADRNCWGVAPLDLDRLVGQVRALCAEVDYVIVSLHWGEERFLIPAPLQIHQARALVEAGASMVLGHHPHVVQGLERYHDAPIIYSLGNFIADNVCFSDGDVLRWSRAERTGCILVAELTADKAIQIRQIPTCDDCQTVDVDSTGFGDRRIQRANRALARGVTLGRYRREHLWVKTIVPTLRHLRWSELKRVRLRHFRNAARIFLRSRNAG